MKNELVAQNLYEIPSCTICLQQLAQQICSLACGHVFHISCITQHFQYRGSCPNCQKRAMLKEIRLVVYPVVRNSHAATHMRKLLSSLENSEAIQIQCLLTEIKQLSVKNEKFNNDISQFDKQSKKLNAQVCELKREAQSRTSQLQICHKQVTLLKSECGTLKIENQKLQSENIDLRVNCDLLREKLRQLEQYRVLQKIAQSSSQDMAKYKYELQNKNTPPQIIAREFYEMLQLKNLNFLKTKEKQREMLEKYRIKEDENNKLKDQIKGLKVQISELENEKNKVRRKYDELRLKYKEISQKYRNLNQENSQIHDEDSFSYSMSMKIGAIKPTPPPQKPATFTLVQKPKVQQKISFGNKNLKKKASQSNKSTMKNFLL